MNKKTILLLAVLSAFLIVSGRSIILLHTNDIMDVFDPRGATFINPDFPPKLGGVYSFATAVEWERKKAEKNGDILLLTDSGNFSVKYLKEDSVSMERPVAVFNYLGYDIINLGIDEISSGPRFVQRNIKRLNMPVLLSNISFPGYPLNVKDYHIFDIEGVRIGVFGLTTEYAVFDLKRHVLEQADIDREIATARRVVNLLKKNRCHIIIGLTSIGFEHDRKLADTVEGIDVILGGYEGRGMREPYETPVNHTVIFKGYGELSSYEKIVLELDELNYIKGYSGESVTLFEDAFPPDPELKNKLQNKD
ncbi:MAG: hypothetical protein SVK54_03890 [candidate division WOR-3 bacterium]|nr:hypothetical protein [candidate division WOR-3 bacterium]